MQFKWFFFKRKHLASVEVQNPDVTAMLPYQRAAAMQANVQQVPFSLSVFFFLGLLDFFLGLK